MSSDYTPGTEIYFLDRIDSTLEKGLEVLEAILKSELEARDRIKANITAERELAEAKQTADISNLFGEVLRLAKHEKLLTSFILRLDETSLAALASTFTAIQDIIHVKSMADMKAKLIAEGATPSNNLDEVTAPIVGIFPAE